MEAQQTQRQVIAVFTENDFDREYLCRALEAYYAQALLVVPVTIATVGVLPAPPRAVVVNKTSQRVVRLYFPDSAVVYAQRFINGSNLEQLIQLPAGKTVLVVNKPREIAEETIHDLKSMGVNHLNLVPYWPGSDLDASAYDTAAFVGFRSYCPERIERYIDLGYRSIAPSTLAEIAKIYDLPTASIDAAQMQFVEMVVKGLYRTERAHLETRMLKQALEQVCQLSANAILNLDHMGVLRICNPAAEKLLGVAAEALLGQPYEAGLRPFKQLLRLVEQGRDCLNEVIYLLKKPVLATLHHVVIDDSRQTILSLIPVETLQDTEERARSNLHHRGFTAKYAFGDIKGESDALRRVITLARYYARSDATVLITGESGTGKELFAQSIHNQSGRAHEAFVGVNFAAIPENLIESELFGYEEGAFTGAVKGGRQGLFRSAHRGTIFLDEIGDISYSMQSRLLRVLEEREIMPVGSSRVIPVDVRVICATNKDLLRMVEEGTFRDDLYYRLKVFQLQVPPLRQRKEDIPLLLEFLSGVRLPENILECFLAYDWPGNIRELKAIAQQLSLFGEVPGPGTEERQVWEEIIDSFFLHASLPRRPDRGEPPPEEDLLLLRCIRALCRSGRCAGRYSLAKCPELQQRGMSETRIKGRLERLREQGYVAAGRTRQGVSLTALGEALLRGR